LTVDELFLNAVIHGNKDDASKSVAIKVDLDDEKITITITDQGEGFDWQRVLDRNTPADLENEGGRGIFLVKHYVDSIHYNKIGNEVRVTIKRGRVAPNSKLGRGNRTGCADFDLERIITIGDDREEKDD
jgi:anti-sigma regulatory factor (Ser/Thr protein kinase)